MTLTNRRWILSLTALALLLLAVELVFQSALRRLHSGIEAALGPRAAMSRVGRVELAFTQEGRLDDPKFSLNELFAARSAVGLAEKLGVSLGAMVEGVGSIVKGLFGR